VADERGHGLGRGVEAPGRDVQAELGQAAVQFRGAVIGRIGQEQEVAAAGLEARQKAARPGDDFFASVQDPVQVADNGKAGRARGLGGTHGRSALACLPSFMSSANFAAPAATACLPNAATLIFRPAMLPRPPCVSMPALISLRTKCGSASTSPPPRMTVSTMRARSCTSALTVLSPFFTASANWRLLILVPSVPIFFRFWVAKWRAASLAASPAMARRLATLSSTSFSGACALGPMTCTR